MPTLLAATGAVWLLLVLIAPPPRAAEPQVAGAARTTPHSTQFATSHECLACHNGLTTPDGEDVSIGVSWRASMMANSSRDPYWQASVRREILDHPESAREIEDECAICHMPMARTTARAAGRHGEIFTHLAGGGSPDSRLAADGVSCTLCHQIGPDRLGTRASFTGGFAIASPDEGGGRRLFGPFMVDNAHASIMRSATAMTPAQADHVRQSEICATCHTLYTQALGPGGTVVGELPEQVPYLEWQHSAFRDERSCQSCHMPPVPQPTRMSSVLGELREAIGRHTFLGGNFFMLRMLNRYRTEVAAEAQPSELEASARATIAQLQQDTAAVSIATPATSDGRLVADLTVRNLTGHKLPTAYPARRVWLHVVVRDAAGGVVFESGAVEPSGLIRGNDNDADAARYEPHYTEIRSEDQVQIYESVLHDINGRVTTGLLHATGYVKDNRLLPRGFDKRTAAPDIAVIGNAVRDDDFAAEADTVRYLVNTAGRTGPFRIEAELRYQPISFRWARNLQPYDARETRRFVAWYDAMSSGSSTVLARAAVSVP